MLTSIRNAFSKGIARLILILLMGLLVVSFAVWGIGDIFRSGGRNVVASVGDVEIGIQQFQTAYNREVQNLSRQVGRGISPDQARAFGMDQRVLAQLMTEATLDERGRKLGLNLDEDTLRRRIIENPTFKGPTGQFDRSTFAELLRSNGFTEQSFIELERKLAVRQQLSYSLTDKTEAPRLLIEAMHQYQSETRTAEYVVLDAKAAGTRPEPTDEQLSSFFERRKAVYRAPEYRKLVILAVTPEQLAPFVEISDARIEEELKRIGETLEKRTVQQIRFPDPAAAESASKRLKEGLAFDTLATEMNLKPADIDLGTVSKAQMIDPAVRDAAFSLAENTPSPPVAGLFGTVILRVTKIETGNQATAKEQIRQKLLADSVRDQSNSIYDRVEKERASGLPLADIATKVGQEPIVIDEVDRDGKDAAGAPVTIPGDREVLAPAFRVDVGVESDPVQVRPVGYVWYEVSAITPPRDRVLQDVRDRVVADWKIDDLRSHLGTIATEISEAVKKGSTLADQAKTRGLEVKVSKAMTRTATEDEWSASAVQTLFTTPMGQVASALASDGNDRLVFITKDVVLPPIGTIDAKGLEQLNRGLEDDLLAQFIQRSQRDLGTTVNRSLLRRAAGSTEQ